MADVFGALAAAQINSWSPGLRQTQNESGLPLARPRSKNMADVVDAFKKSRLKSGLNLGMKNFSLFICQIFVRIHNIRVRMLV